jgi:hypothetical protein
VFLQDGGHVDAFTFASYIAGRCPLVRIPSDPEMEEWYVNPSYLLFFERRAQETVLHFVHGLEVLTGAPVDRILTVLNDYRTNE